MTELLQIRHLKNALFVILFAWISFFPQPIQEQYSLYFKLFLAIFVLILFKAKDAGKAFVLNEWPLWLFLFFLLPGVFTACDRTIALKTYLNLSVVFLFVYFIGKKIAAPEENFNFLIYTICICGIAVSAIGFFEVFFGYDPLYKYFIHNQFYSRYIHGTVRPMSTLYNPAPLATYLLFTWPFAIPLCRQKKLLGYLTLNLSIICLVLTFSRGSFLGLIFTMVCYLLFTKKYRAALILAGFAIITLIAFGSLPYPFSRLSLRGISIQGTGIFSEYRIIRTKMALEMLKSNPVFGVGLNNFRVLFDNFYPLRAGLQNILYEIKIPDNMYLSLLAETGIAGISGFIILVFSLFYKGIKELGRISNTEKKQLLVTSLSILVGILFSMAGYELFYWASPYMLFCLVCGFIQGALTAEKKNGGVDEI